MGWTPVLAFLAAVTPLVLTPGASLVLTTHRVLAHGRRAVPAVIAGTATGIYCHAVLAAVGLAALVMASSVAFQVVRLAGAAYLVALGLSLWWRSSRGAPEVATTPPAEGRDGYVAALLANLLNPKAAGIYLTVVPQVLPAGQIGLAPVLGLATAHVAVMALWLGLWSEGVRRGGARIRRGSAGRGLDRVGGTVLVVLGVRTALA